MRKKYDYKVINCQKYFTNKRCQVNTRVLTSLYSKTLFLSVFIALIYFLLLLNTFFYFYQNLTCEM